MSGASGPPPTGAPAPEPELEPQQREALERLVGAAVAREDERAVARAYADFRDAMEALRREFRGGSRG